MIEEGRTSLVIRNGVCSPEYFAKFEKAFSTYNMVTHEYENRAYTIINNDIFMPAFVGADHITSYFPNEIVLKNFNSTPKGKTIKFNIKNEPRDIDQVEALEFLKKIKDDGLHARMLNLATGKGKTYLTINLISYLQKCAMIVVDSLDLAEQWKREILKHSDLNESDIMLLSGQESITSALRDKDVKIFIAIHKTLHSLLEQDVNAMNNLMRKLKIGFRIFDECHLCFKNICDINALSNSEYSLFLTATPSRSDFKENRVYNKILGNIPYFNGHKDTNELYHKICLFQVNTVPNAKERSSVKTKYGFSQVKWANIIAKK